MLDEMFDSDQTFIQHDFGSSNIFFSFSQILQSVKPIQHFIQHAKFMMLDEMLDRFNLAFSNLFVNCSTNKVLPLFSCS